MKFLTTLMLLNTLGYSGEVNPIGYSSQELHKSSLTKRHAKEARADLIRKANSQCAPLVGYRISKIIYKIREPKCPLWAYCPDSDSSDLGYRYEARGRFKCYWHGGDW